MDNFIEDIYTKSMFYNVAKHANGSLVKSENEFDPVAGFIDICKGENVLVLATI